MAFYQDAILYLQRLGFWDIVIPFVFAFTIVFALMQRAKLWGEQGARYNAVIALVFGMFFIYYVDTKDVILFTSYVVILLIASIMYLLLINYLGVTDFKFKWGLYGLLVIFIIIITATWIEWNVIGIVLLNPATIILAVFVGVIWYVVYYKGEKKSAKLSKEDKEFSKKYKEEQRPKREYPKGGVLLREKEPV
jgi:hypothetical protein